MIINEAAGADVAGQGVYEVPEALKNCKNAVIFGVLWMESDIFSFATA